MEDSEKKYCPSCNSKLDHAFARRMITEGIPAVAVLRMGIGMMAEAGCPRDVLQPAVDWAMKQEVSPVDLTDEERDHLKRLKWDRWASQA